METVYLVVGTPGSGKTWVCEQLEDKFNYCPHDDYLDGEDMYIDAIVALTAMGMGPVLGEAPFSVSKFKSRLEGEFGFKLVIVFIIEDPKVVAERYYRREGKEIPKGHLTRINTYKQRAIEYGAFLGTSQEVLSHLQGLKV